MEERKKHGHTKKYERAGYRVHFDRLKEMYSKSSFMRTHKFLCEIPQEVEKDLKEKFEGVSRVVDSGNEGSILWFLIQLYGLGFLFVPKEGEKAELLRDLGLLNESLGLQDLKNQLTEELRLEIKNYQALWNFSTKTPRQVVDKIRQTGLLPGGIIMDLGSIFLPDEKITSKNFTEYPVIQKWHDRLKEFVLERGDLKKKDIQEFFGFSVEEEDTKGTTFVVQPIHLEEIKKNIESGIDIYRAYFSYVLPAAKRSGRSVQALMGVDNNQNALSNLLGSTLKAFQESEEAARELIAFGNPGLFKKEPERLDILAQAVYRLAKKVALASEADFFQKNWADYRNLIGGRLEGWVSNFQNRLSLLEESLAPEGSHQTIFDAIAVYFSEEKGIFTEEQRLAFHQAVSLRPKIFAALKTVEAEAGDENLGEMLFQYNRYIAEIREILMKWNNEGIPEVFRDKIDIKTICDKKTAQWSEKYIPDELDQYPRFIGEAARDPKQEIRSAMDIVLDFSVAGQQMVHALVGLDKNREYSSDFRENWLDGKRLYRHFLEKLKEVSDRSEHSRRFQSFFENEILLDNPLSKEIWNRKGAEKFRFYVSGYERGRHDEIPVKQLSYDDFLKKFGEFFGVSALKTREDFEKYFNFPHIKTENGEILKMYWALLFRPLSDKVFLPDDIANLSVLEKIGLYDFLKAAQFEKRLVSLAIVRRFIQSGIGSEIRAKSSLLSRKSFIERNVICTTNGEQSFLQYIPIEWGDFSHLQVTKSPGKRKRFTNRKLKRIKEKVSIGFSEQARKTLESCGIEYQGKSNQEIAEKIWNVFSKQNLKFQRGLARVLGEMPHGWAMVLKTKKPLTHLPEPASPSLFVKKSTNKTSLQLATKGGSSHLYALPLKTSVYQKQFLEGMLWGDQGNLIDKKMKGSSVIIEQEKQVKWNGREIVFEDGKFSLYWAVPFEFEKPQTKTLPSHRFLEGTAIEITNASQKEQKQYRCERNILGIDLGEYGFGWAVFDPRAEKFIASGFQRIPLLKKMRVEAASWRDTQARGIFSRPTTYLADIREQAAGQTRNQIHRLAIKYRAIPIYEDSVDGFESGGQRIEKLYKTLKTSDVIGPNSNAADKVVRRHFWGNDYAQIGGVIGASKTSQTCRGCGRCATAEIEEKIKQEKDESVKVRLREERDRIKQAQRGSGSDGGQSLFICQLCGRKTHADEQAAKNIALKYFFKLTASEEEVKRYCDEDGVFSTLKLFLEKSKESKYCDVVTIDVESTRIAS
jgi:hypothetical protein